MRTMPQYNRQLLQLLGLSESAGESEVEQHRIRLCEMLGLTPTVSDDALVKVAAQVGFEGFPQEQKSGTGAKPAVDPNVLANIPRTTITGLRTVSNLRNTHSGIKPLHARQTGEQTMPAPIEEGEQAAPPVDNSGKPPASN